MNLGSSHGAFAFGIGLHPGLGEGDDLIRGRDLVHEAHFLGLGRTDLIALEQHLQRVRRRHQPRNALRAARAGEEPDLNLGQADTRLVAVGGDAIVAGEREFEAPAHAHPVDRGGDRLAAGFEPPVDQRELLRPVDKSAHRGLLAVRLGAARIFLARGLEHREIRSPAKPSLPEVKTAPLIAASLVILFTICPSSSTTSALITFIDRPGMSQVTSATPSASVSKRKLVRFI